MSRRTLLLNSGAHKTRRHEERVGTLSGFLPSWMDFRICPLLFAAEDDAHEGRCPLIVSHQCATIEKKSAAGCGSEVFWISKHWDCRVICEVVLVGLTRRIEFPGPFRIWLLGLFQMGTWTANSIGWTLPAAGALVGYVATWIVIR
jgi:hypothetical protein